MFVIIYHNYHANPGSGNVCIGPFTERPLAIEHLREMERLAGDSDFKTDEEAGFLGYDAEELDNAGRDTELASDIRAEVVELTPPGY